MEETHFSTFNFNLGPNAKTTFGFGFFFFLVGFKLLGVSNVIPLNYLL